MKGEEEEEKEERYGCYDDFVWKLFEYGTCMDISGSIPRV